MKFIQKYVHWLPVVIWMGLIFYLSHQPAEQSSELSSGFMDILLHILFAIFPADGDFPYLHFFIRKAAHFFAYFLLGVFVIYAVRRSVKQLLRSTYITLIICILYAISDEVHQLFIPGRSGEIRDVMIDSLGAICGLFTFILIHKLTKTRHT